MRGQDSRKKKNGIIDRILLWGERKGGKDQERRWTTALSAQVAQNLLSRCSSEQGN